MVHIEITKGLNIPIKGGPIGTPKSLVPGGETSFFSPSQIALDLSEFSDLKLRLLVKAGDPVKIGDPLAEDKASPGRFFVAPAGGIINDIVRGLRRVPTRIVIDVAKDHEEYRLFPTLNPSNATREDLVNLLKNAGIFTCIRQRPFNVLADLTKIPRSIFVKAIESAPFVPSAEMQVEGFEKEFQLGLDALSVLTPGVVHLVYRNDSPFKAFSSAKNVTKHTAEGPHPIANSSLHIEKIDPIETVDAIIWTLSARDVVAIGYLLTHGRCYHQKVISVAGPALLPEKMGYFKVREGFPIFPLISGRVPKGHVRLISGDLLMGKTVSAQDFLGFSHTAVCALPENAEREFLHFFRLGTDKYSFSRAYLSGHFNNQDRQYDFTTSLHGEPRPFIDSTLYDEVMPLDVPTMLLVKAVMAEDYDLAVNLGLLEVDSEDFALPTFVCPSKMEMTDIIKNGLQAYAKEMS
ncbi:MAG: Na(+)-translocating NADH-quinone reductase subunit A [Parachlamydiaceae bacterium]|nr:Na(+)-translocating NADH-quinone reductase subunit A [Parachlamydiaceae bacterium]